MQSDRTAAAVAGVIATVLLAAGCTSAVPGEAVGLPSTTTSSPTTSSAEPSPSVAAAVESSTAIAPAAEVVLVARAGIDRSTDGGQTWERVETPAAPYSFATDGTIVLAAADVAADPPTTAVLLSQDQGSSWTVAATDLPAFQQLGHGPSGFLAVGYQGGIDDLSYDVDDGQLDFVVGASVDGSTWTTTPVTVPVGGYGQAALNDLTWNGTTWSLTVVSGRDEDAPATEILTSPDGLTWTAGPVWPVSVAPASMAWTGQTWGWVGHVLDGYARNDQDTDFVPRTRPVVGSSADGAAWTAAVPTPADSYLGSLTCTAGGWLAVTQRWWDQDQDVVPRLQRSADLATWEPQGADLVPVAAPYGGQAAASDVVVLGAEPDPQACGSAVTAPLDQFALVPIDSGGFATGPATAPGAAIEGDGVCTTVDPKGRSVVMVSNLTVYPGYPPSALYCDAMTTHWADDVNQTPEPTALPCYAEAGEGTPGGGLAGFLATCPVSPKFAFHVAETGTAADTALREWFRSQLDELGVAGGPTGGAGGSTGGGGDTGGTGGTAADELGVGVAMTLPPCDGSVAVIVGTAVGPDYAAEVSAFLRDLPGASYVRTNLSCSSFRQALNGNPIYAVYFLHPPGTGCEAVYAQGGDANGRILQDATPEASQLPC